MESQCLLSTRPDHLTILLGIQPAEVYRLRATLFLANRGTDTLDSDQILHCLFIGFSETRKVRLRSKPSFVLEEKTIEQPRRIRHPRSSVDELK